MAAAYAALLSLSHTIEQLQKKHPLSLDQTKVQSISENTCFLLDFLENYAFADSKEADAWEGRVADAAYEAEEMIESQFIDHGTMSAGFTNFYRSLFKSTSPEKVMQNMDSITKDAKKKTKTKTRIVDDGDDELQKNNHIPNGGSSFRSLPNTNMIMVGFDDILVEMKDKLTNTGRGTDLKIIPIVGMGGSGKTALAGAVYEDPLVVEYFDIRVCFTISKKYNRREILVQSLLCLKQTLSQQEYVLSEKSEYELGELLFKSLSGRRYLVVMDDLWDVEAWESMKFFFPEYNNGSRIVVTTRLNHVALSIADSEDVVKMKLLDEDNSWNLFCKIVFLGEESCPPNLEEMGKRITKSCKGLPLSITVIGGLLSKNKQSLRFWKNVLENFNDVLNSEDGERCSKILSLSYKELPINLKPCFLYMGASWDDRVIPKSAVIRLWVAEGFVKPTNGESLEIAAENHLKDLVDRNLVLVEQLGSTGNIKYCKIHDLLRDLCIKEARKRNFMCIIEAQKEEYSPFKIQRRTVFHSSLFGDHYIRPWISSSLRSLICDLRKGAAELKHLAFKSVKVLKVVHSPHLVPAESHDSMTSIPVNLQLLDFDCEKLPLAPPIVHLWSIPPRIVTIDIWKMPRLRHVKCQGLDLPDPPFHFNKKDNDLLVALLDNLETLKGVRNFKCSSEGVKRIPNIKKLGIQYVESGHYYLNNLCRLHKLESLVIIFTGPLDTTRSIDSLSYIRPSELGWSLRLPHSLRKLNLWCIQSAWEKMGTTIGTLPHLQVLKLIHCHLGPQWVTVEGQFQQLKYLHVGCGDLVEWIMEDHKHFPRLEQLVLDTLSSLEEIPQDIGYIPTLKSIHVSNCRDSVLDSAKNIKEEQMELGNEDLQVLFMDDYKYRREFSEERFEKLKKMREMFEKNARLMVGLAQQAERRAYEQSRRFNEQYERSRERQQMHQQHQRMFEHHQHIHQHHQRMSFADSIHRR